MHEVLNRVLGVLRFFSVGLLATTLFYPFRQISAGRTNGSIKARFIAWGDKLFSRLIGAVVRLMLISVGLIFALFVAILGLLLIIAWPFLPVAPLIGVFIMQSGFRL
jgi:hypothetical protein